ncbi:hypothetical protein RISK_004581 [Rhodopirellula islandica]|uniref:Uncharacterized protein n=1 Tax=Rhodopirellula islandica TaxID=595434 RepID=A0A0J1ECG8_RHOIS|nr:hypothetical protein RISK_004581 [Rhodopirellula islandica]
MVAKRDQLSSRRDWGDGWALMVLGLKPKAGRMPSRRD